MPSLREAQEHFAAALLGKGGGVRIEAYRRNVVANARGALAATYPVAMALVGGDFFIAAADDYAWVHPSRSGNLDEFGGAFPDFLRRYAPADGMPWLADVAALELEVDRASRAADSDAVPQDVVRALAAVPAERLDDVRLTLHPAIALVACRHGAMRLWQVHQPGYDGEFSAPLETAPEWLLVARDAQGVSVERIDESEFTWLQALRAGRRLERASHEAASVDRGFDLAAALQRRIADSTLTGVLP